VAGLPNGGGAKLIVVEALKPAPIVDGRLKGAGRASGATGYLIRGRPVFVWFGQVESRGGEMPEERTHDDRLKAQLHSASGRTSKLIRDRERIEAVVEVPEAGTLVLSVDAGGAYSLRRYREKSDDPSAEDVLAFGVMGEE
jgi:hypothetical protein